MMADQLDHALQRLGAGIAEEHEVGKALVAEAVRELLAVGAPEQIRHVPELRRLFLQCRDQMRVSMAQRVHRNPRGEVEIAVAIGGDEVAALSARETEIDPGENGKQMRRGAGAHGGHFWG